MTLANPVGNLADWHNRHRRRNQEQLNDPTELGIRRTIYSDSRNAMAWARAGHCRTKLPLHAKSEQVLRLVERAEAWLAKNGISVPVLKWQTELWGEVPADFGRK